VESEHEKRGGPIHWLLKRSVSLKNAHGFPVSSQHTQSHLMPTVARAAAPLCNTCVMVVQRACSSLRGRKIEPSSRAI
jgi:hypothetical protein